MTASRSARRGTSTGYGICSWRQDTVAAHLVGMVLPVQRIYVNARAAHEETIAAAVRASTRLFLQDLATGREPARAWDAWAEAGRMVRVIDYEDPSGSQARARAGVPEFTVTAEAPIFDLPTGGDHAAPGASYDVHVTLGMTTSEAVSMAVRATWIHLAGRLLDAPEDALDWFRRGCPVNVTQSRRAGVSTRGAGLLRTGRAVQGMLDEMPSV